MRIEKIKKISEIRIASVKFKKYFQSRLLIDYERNQKNKNKKIFLDSSPHDEPAQKGEGVRVENIPSIYSAVNYPVLAICVRTQNDFNLKGGITAHSDNKTRLNRLICLHNGHYTHKRNRSTAKNVYLCII